MIKVLKEGKIKSHKEIQENTSKQLEAINKFPFKKSRIKKQLKELNKSVQTLKIKIKAAKKTQTENSRNEIYKNMIRNFRGKFHYKI